MLKPIYRYHATSPERYLFSQDPNITSGWTNEGIAYYAHENLEPDTVAFYALHRVDPWVGYIYPENGGRSWMKNDGLAFYAYSAQKPGTLPVYDYGVPRESFPRQLLSTDPNIGSGWTRQGTAFCAVSGKLDWKYQFDALVYDEANYPSTQKELLQSNTIRNPGQGSTVNQTVSMNHRKSSSFEWGLTETLQWDDKTMLTVGAPFGLGSVSEELDVSLVLSSNQTYSMTKEVEYSVSDGVTVEAGHSKNVSGFVDWVNDLTVPFTLTMRVSAVGGSEQLTGTQVKDLFQMSNPSTTIKTVEDRSIVVSLRGTFTGTYGLKTELVVTDIINVST